VRTEELIRTLAADAPAAPPRSLAPQLVLAAVIAGVAWVAVMIAATPYGMPAQSAPHGWFWMKNAYSVVLALAGLAAVTRLARPGGRMGWAVWLAAAAIVWLLVMAIRETALAAPGQVAPLWLGQTWKVCATRIMLFSIPTFVATFWLLRRMAPTRPALTGAAAGFFAGAVGAATYGLYCQESAAAFVVAWYTLGIAICAAIGAGAGRWLLRW
jgi:hypothetical protein